MLSLSTRQRAYAFNQPLSWDTSSVTTMDSMFQVRSARAPASRPHTWVFCLHAACAAAAPSPSRVHARLSPLFLCCFPFDSAGRNRVQPAAELGHVQRHDHARHVLRALPARAPASRLHSWVLCLRPACAAFAPTPSRLHALPRPGPTVAYPFMLPFRLGSKRRRSTSR